MNALTWRSIVAAGLILAGLSLTACTSPGAAKDTASDTSGASAANIDTCKLITQAEAAKALGEPVRAGTKDPTTSQTACTWQSTKDLPIEMVMIDLQPQFDSVYKNMDSPQITAAFVVTKVSGIGDKAYTQSTKGDTGGSDYADLLGVKKGDVALYFSVVRESMTKAQGFAADKQLAAEALTRIGS